MSRLLVRCSADDDIRRKLSRESMFTDPKRPINVFSSDYDELGSFGTGNISCDAEFSVAASAKVGPYVKYAPKYLR